MIRPKLRYSDSRRKGVAYSALELVGSGISTSTPGNRANRNRQWTRRKTHFVQYIDDKSLRRAFYQALLDIEWLPSKIHSAVMSELGLSLQKRKSDFEEGRTLILNVLVDECKARMRENGEQPRGGIHDSAVAEIAARHGMTAEALKQRITRLNKKRPRK
jgi:hypothetical protein